jgi:two-component sensor histidine kinase
MAKELTGRLAALGRAHDPACPLPGSQGRAALLGDLLSVLLSPYEDLGAFSGRIRVAVPRIGVGDASATALSLIIHELATNSVKYSALSADTGTPDVSGSTTGADLELVWLERGGPKVEPPAAAEGYGSKLVRRSVAGACLGGMVGIVEADAEELAGTANAGTEPRIALDGGQYARVDMRQFREAIGAQCRAERSVRCPDRSRIVPPASRRPGFS